MQHELNEFMDRIFRDQGKDLLSGILEDTGIFTVDTATSSKRKRVAEKIRSMFPFMSVARSNILYAELMKILKVGVYDLGNYRHEEASKVYYDEEGNTATPEEVYSNRFKKYFSSKKEYLKYRIEKQRKIIGHFWEKVDRSLTKFEVVFNMFWLKAGEAELRGMDHDEVMKITNKAILGIKNDLEESYRNIQKDFGIRNIEKHNLSNLKFNFRKADILSRYKNLDPEIRKRYEGEEDIIKEVGRFWQDIDKIYKNFNDVFIRSMNKDIELKKRNMDDDELVKETEHKMIEIWNQIEKSHDRLKENLDDIQEKATKDKVKKKNEKEN